MLVLAPPSASSSLSKYIKIYFSTDAEGEQVVATQKSLLTNGKYCISQNTLSQLHQGTDYYLYVKYTESGKESICSPPVKISIIGGQNKRGCVLYRHESGIGTVVEYPYADCSWRRLIVADANHRNGNSSFSTVAAGISCSLETYPLSEYIFGSEYNSKAALPSNFDITTLVDKYGSRFATDKTAKYNCDVWLNASSSIAPINHCRNVSIVHNGVTRVMDLPNIWQGCLLYLLGDVLDAMDPNSSSYSTYKLGYANPNGRFNDCYLWTSTNDVLVYDNVNKMNKYTVKVMTQDGIIGYHFQYINVSITTKHFFTCPILEI